MNKLVRAITGLFFIAGLMVSNYWFMGGLFEGDAPKAITGLVIAGVHIGMVTLFKQLNQAKEL